MSAPPQATPSTSTNIADDLIIALGDIGRMIAGEIQPGRDFVAHRAEDIAARDPTTSTVTLEGGPDYASLGCIEAIKLQPGALLSGSCTAMPVR